MNNTKILLKKIIEEKIQNEKLEIDISELTNIYQNEVKDNLSLKALYEKALYFITENDVESALKYLIVILDLDNNHQESLHLCKTLLYNISLYLTEKKADSYKQKYNSLKESRDYILNRNQELQTSLKSNKDNLSVQEKNKFSRDFKSDPKQIIQNIVEFKRNIMMAEMELRKIQKDVEIINKLYTLECYGKIASTILETCILIMND